MIDSDTLSHVSDQREFLASKLDAFSVEDTAEQRQQEEIAAQCDSYSEYQVTSAVHGIQTRSEREFLRDRILGRRSKFRYSSELVEDMQAMHGISIENELKTVIANEIAAEIDYEIGLQAVNQLFGITESKT